MKVLIKVTNVALYESENLPTALCLNELTRTAGCQQLLNETYFNGKHPWICIIKQLDRNG